MLNACLILLSPALSIRRGGGSQQFTGFLDLLNRYKTFDRLLILQQQFIVYGYKTVSRVNQGRRRQGRYAIYFGCYRVSTTYFIE